MIYGHGSFLHRKTVQFGADPVPLTWRIAASFANRAAAAQESSRLSYRVPTSEKEPLISTSQADSSIRIPSGSMSSRSMVWSSARGAAERGIRLKCFELVVAITSLSAVNHSVY